MASVRETGIHDRPQEDIEQRNYHRHVRGSPDKGEREHGTNTEDDTELREYKDPHGLGWAQIGWD